MSSLCLFITIIIIIRDAQKRACEYDLIMILVYKNNSIRNAYLNYFSDITVNLTPMSQMNSEIFARKMTGGEQLTIEQKKQIREQQEVNIH